MIIGVDAGALSINDDRLKVGVYRVIVNLLRQLGKLDTSNEYRLYSFTPIDRKLMRSFGPRMKNILVRPTFAWSRIQLPLHLRFNPVDVFLGLSQFVPPTSARSIGFIYDVNFLRHPEFHPGSYIKLKQNTDALVSRSAHIVTISEASKKDIEKFYNWIPGPSFAESFGRARQARNDKKKIIVAYPGVSEAFTRFGKYHKQTHPYFLFVGSLKRGKNIPRIIRAFAAFRSFTKQQYVLIFSGGDYWRDPEIDKELSAVSRQLSAKNIKDCIQFTGVVTDEQLAEYYRGARALVSPSLWEGFCLPAAEALACGTPVIGSTSGSMPEVVGKAGILVKPTSEEEMMKAMIVMTKDTGQYKKMKALASDQAKQFTWEGFARKVLGVL